jgi:hypothetical protein
MQLGKLKTEQPNKTCGAGRALDYGSDFKHLMAVIAQLIL